MTEKERKIVIDRINKDVEKNKLREEKKQRQEELKQSDAVKEYLKLSSEIKKLNEELKFFRNKEEITELEFIWALTSKNKDNNFLPCNHDIWIYCSSYYLSEDPSLEHVHEYLVSSEQNENFSYNKYKCLECSKIIQVENWEEFEEYEFVLKNRKDIDSKKYISLYYQLLYNHSVKESQNIVINEFNKNKKIKIKELKKIKI